MRYKNWMNYFLKRFENARHARYRWRVRRLQRLEERVLLAVLPIAESYEASDRSSSSLPQNLLLDISGDGVDWRAVAPSLLALRNVWTNYSFDLDSLLSGEGIAHDDDVFVRFRKSDTAAAKFLLVDDVRIDRRDVYGAAVTSITPSGVIAPPLTSIDVTFSKPINVDTFTAPQVALSHAVGQTWTRVGDPADSGDHRRFSSEKKYRQ